MEYCLLKSKPCWTRNWTDWGSMTYSSEHSKVRLYTCTRYVSAAWGDARQRGEDCGPEAANPLRRTRLHLLLQLLVAGDAQREDGAGARCVANGLVAVLYGPEPRQNTCLETLI